MKHLITGGCGFLGTLIANQLTKRGEDVVLLDVHDDVNRNKKAQFIKGSVLDRKLLSEIMKDIDIVHHNAALVPLTKSGEDFAKVNVEGSRAVAEEAVKCNVKTFIHMSSSAIYGNPSHCPITKDTPLLPIEIYGKSKLDGEKAVVKVCNEGALHLIVIRPRTILGEGRLGIFQILFKWIQEGVNIYIIGKGEHLFQFVHAHDLIDAYMLAMDRKQFGIYNVGTDSFKTLAEDLEDLIAFAKSKSKLRRLPEKLSIFALTVLDFLKLSPLAPWHYLTYHKAFHFDVTPLKELGWKPKYSNTQLFEESYSQFLETDLELKKGGSPHRRILDEKILWLMKKLP